LLVRHARQFRGRIIGIRETVRVGQREAGAPSGDIISDRGHTRSLLDLGETVSIVVGIGDLRLTDHRHCGATAGSVVRVVHRPLRRDFLRQAV
jgi:hypothetical protein